MCTLPPTAQLVQSGNKGANILLWRAFGEIYLFSVRWLFYVDTEISCCVPLVKYVYSQLEDCCSLILKQAIVTSLWWNVCILSLMTVIFRYWKKLLWRAFGEIYIFSVCWLARCSAEDNRLVEPSLGQQIRAILAQPLPGLMDGHRDGVGNIKPLSSTKVTLLRCMHYGLMTSS